MATQLAIYNHALLTMKERRLASLSEDRESRHILDEFYDQVVQYCLEQGMWKFAMRSTSLSQAGAGSYGFTYVFNKPSDFIHLFEAGENASFDPPLVYGFADEASVFYGNTSTLYIRYSSNGASYGGNLLAWPQGFTEYVSAELGSWAAYAITGSERTALVLNQRANVLLANSLSLFSLVAPPGQLPLNSRIRSMSGGEANNLSPQLQPFGAEVKAMLASAQQKGS